MRFEIIKSKTTFALIKKRLRKWKTSFIAFSFFAVSILQLACSNNEGDAEKPVYSSPIKIDLSATELQLTGESQNFAANLFSTIHELQANDPESENIVISPLSLNMALAMVWNGANGETKQAIQKAMGMGDYPQSEVNDYFKKVRENFVKTDPTVKLSIANSIWTRQDFSVKSSFYDVNKNFYQAEVKEVDFSSPNAPSLINQWCFDNTNGLIKEIIEGKISNDVMMYLINALYFKGEWSDHYGFDPVATSDAAFTKENGSSTQVKMMNQNNTLPYYNDEYLSTTSLPFGNDAFSMAFFLPNENVSFAEMLNQLKQPSYFAQCLQSSGKADVDLYIPKFTTEYEITLNETLKQLGMDIAFTDGADFSGISDTPLCISNVKQKTSVSVDEKGGEAAAVTVVEVIMTSVDPTNTPKTVFRADRPFLFVIRENSTGVVLFMGKIGGVQ
ncbi:MAG: serpin family protein [Candidatus Azobacteroides sp.]|nr:serpin family protein [Candidatus Azobacteroides sp.]